MFVLFWFFDTEQNTLSSFSPQKVQYSNIKNTVILKKGPSKRGFSMAVRTFKKALGLGRSRGLEVILGYN